MGLLLTQIAKSKGAEVFTTVGNEAKAELSRGAGSDHVIRYDSVDFKEAVEAIAGPNAIDVVYDGVGAATFDLGLDLLRPRGTMVTFGNASGPPRDISPLILAAKGSIYLTRPTMRHYLATRAELLSRASDLFSMIEQRKPRRSHRRRVRVESGGGSAARARGPGHDGKGASSTPPADQEPTARIASATTNGSSR